MIQNCLNLHVLLQDPLKIYMYRYIMSGCYATYMMLLHEETLMIDYVDHLLLL